MAKLYAIPNWDADAAVLLAEWIMDTYSTESLQLVALTLQSPPVGTSKAWRLTPDTVSEWMSKAIEDDISKREREVHNAKHESNVIPIGEISSENADEWLSKWLDSIEKIDDKFKSPPMTEAEIKRYGSPIPPQMKYRSTGVEHLVIAEQRAEYAREHTDMIMGTVKPGSPSFDEWLRSKTENI